jgi:glycosyltransferase involved in cell wall biosynthesis
MKYYIVIPAHNEQDLIGLTLQSLVSQTVLPSKVVVVNDNSTDKTEEVVLGFAKDNPYISVVNFRRYSHARKQSDSGFSERF